ncbi:T9SS type A sorting domain-containing protein, partial [Rubrivirga sp.]|uniref:T9SS type A sorting domain-containing protein n=1 Tax=Rubrivirga sp. TaxID=1885344 RepID=UPI003C77151F
DYDVTDQDDENLNTQVFMRGGNQPALFRDSFNFGLRGQLVDGAFVMANPISVSEEGGPDQSATRIGTAQPNPFSGVTRIAYSVDTPTHVTLEVYNLLGQRVATLVDQVMPQGDHLATFDAAGLSAGVYLSRLVSEAGVQTSKMVLVR